MVRLLVVEDEAQLAQNIADFLGSFSGEFAVTLAGTGEDALAAVEREPFDVLLTDVRLPGIDGIELVFRALQFRPELSILVMTAFGTPEVREIALEVGALEFVEKPIDLEELRQSIIDASEESQSGARRVGGLTVPEVLQFYSVSGDTGVVRLRFGNRRGTLGFRKGQLVHAAAGSRKGSAALEKMAKWGEGSFQEMTQTDLKRYPKNITGSLSELLATYFPEEGNEGDGDRAASTNAPETAGTAGARSNPDNDAAPVASGDEDDPPNKEGLRMAIKDHLNEFSEIQGFKGVAVFTAQGEMIEGFANGKLDIKTVGTFANNALLNAQKATDQMGVGRGNLMQVRAPEATVIMRCLNEATDFAQTSQGKAHFHTVVVLDPEGNAGMAGMILDKIVGKIAEELR